MKLYLDKKKTSLKAVRAYDTVNPKCQVFDFHRAKTVVPRLRYILLQQREHRFGANLKNLVKNGIGFQRKLSSKGA